MSAAAVLDAASDEPFEDVIDGPPLENEEEEEEEVFAEHGSETGDMFEMVLAELEVLMMDEDLNARIDTFTRKHCNEFVAGDENKLVYTTLFAEYTTMVEAYIEERIGASVASFDMASFCATLSERAKANDELLDAPAFELLASYSDFERFKELMISAQEGLAVEASGGTLCVSGDKLGLSGVGAGPMDADDDDGDTGQAAPDLNDLLSISSKK